METKKHALKKMERNLADKIGVPVANRPNFVNWYRKTLDYRLAALKIGIQFVFKAKK